MFADPLVITYNAVPKNLVRVNQDARGSDYYLDDGLLKFSGSIRHTIPPKGGTGESHMLRIDVDEHDANGVYLRRTSTWLVIKTFDNTQKTVDAGYAANATVGVLGTANVAKLLAREN